ncbi:hypothetical protein B484DRAFT_476604 [Ochromonadaceae sp. CCMP2298]|nr:hypothetical protein B484DRAFT_476604 [Ochromonadaceae sp. CCMP2298]
MEFARHHFAPAPADWGKKKTKKKAENEAEEEALEDADVYEMFACQGGLDEVVLQQMQHLLFNEQWHGNGKGNGKAMASVEWPKGNGKASSSRDSPVAEDASPEALERVDSVCRQESVSRCGQEVPQEERASYGSVVQTAMANMRALVALSAAEAERERNDIESSKSKDSSRKSGSRSASGKRGKKAPPVVEIVEVARSTVLNELLKSLENHPTPPNESPSIISPLRRVESSSGSGAAGGAPREGQGPWKDLSAEVCLANSWWHPEATGQPPSAANTFGAVTVRLGKRGRYFDDVCAEIEYVERLNYSGCTQLKPLHAWTDLFHAGYCENHDGLYRDWAYAAQVKKLENLPLPKLKKKKSLDPCFHTNEACDRSSELRGFFPPPVPVAVHHPACWFVETPTCVEALAGARLALDASKMHPAAFVRISKPPPPQASALRGRVRSGSQTERERESVLFRGIHFDCVKATARGGAGKEVQFEEEEEEEEESEEEDGEDVDKLNIFADRDMKQLAVEQALTFVRIAKLQQAMRDNEPATQLRARRKRLESLLYSSVVKMQASQTQRLNYPLRPTKEYLLDERGNQIASANVQEESSTRMTRAAEGGGSRKRKDLIGAVSLRHAEQGLAVIGCLQIGAPVDVRVGAYWRSGVVQRLLLDGGLVRHVKVQLQPEGGDAETQAGFRVGVKMRWEEPRSIWVAVEDSRILPYGSCCRPATGPAKARSSQMIEQRQRESDAHQAAAAAVAAAKRPPVGAFSAVRPAMVDAVNAVTANVAAGGPMDESEAGEVGAGNTAEEVGSSQTQPHSQSQMQLQVQVPVVGLGLGLGVGLGLRMHHPVAHFPSAPSTPSVVSSDAAYSALLTEGQPPQAHPVPCLQYPTNGGQFQYPANASVGVQHFMPLALSNGESVKQLEASEVEATTFRISPSGTLEKIKR